MLLLNICVRNAQGQDMSYDPARLNVNVSYLLNIYHTGSYGVMIKTNVYILHTQEKCAE